MRAVVYTGDLIFSSRITATGQAVHVPVGVVREVGDLAPGAGLLMVDLEADGAIDAIERCRTMVPTPRIVAFGPHVRDDLFAAAREAGAAEVLARSAFVTRLTALLQSA